MECSATNLGPLRQTLRGITPVTLVFLTLALLPAGAQAADTDSDGVDDLYDNCTNTPNASQADADADGIGTACDADFNNDCVVDAADEALFIAAFGGTDPLYDLDEDGVVAPSDFAIFSGLFGAPPEINAAGFCHLGDSDGDAIDDSIDNCLDRFNPSQHDANSDGIGNACDPDFNDDCVVDLMDRDLLLAAWGSSDPVYDLDEPPDGLAFSTDYIVYETFLLDPPGRNADNVCARALLSIDAASPSLPVIGGATSSESDVLGTPLAGPGSPVIRAPELGLAGGGLDDLNAMTAGRPVGGSIFYSVDRVAVGSGGLGVASESGVGQAAGDVYWSGDVDLDGVYATSDNCLTAANLNQADADSDGIGTVCDADFDNDCDVDGTDQNLLSNALGSSNPVFDLDEDGTVSVFDFVLFVGLAGRVPGPDAQGICTGNLSGGHRVLNQRELGILPALAAGASAAPPIDNLDALDLPVAPYSGTLAPNFIALATGHGHLGASGMQGCGADLFVPTLGGPPAPAVDWAALGLLDCGDDIDALHHDPDTGSFYFSLSPSSPALTAGSPIGGCGAGCSAADLFVAPGGIGPSSVYVTAHDLGLLPSDNVDAIHMPEPNLMMALAAGSALLHCMARRRCISAGSVGPCSRRRRQWPAP